MRILLVSFIDNNCWSGMGNWSHRMAESLEKLGYSVTCWFRDDFPITRRFARCAVLILPWVLAFRLLINRNKFDFVVVHEPIGLWYSFLRKFLKGLPTMISICHNVESKHFKDLLRASSRGLATVSLGTRIKTPLC